MYDAGKVIVHNVNRFLRSLKCLETPHVGKAQDNNQQEDCCEDDFENEQFAVFKLWNVIHLFDDSINVQWDEGPMNDFGKKCMLERH